MKIVVIRTAKGKQKWADMAVENWKKRFSGKLPFDELVLKPAPDHYTVDKRREQESLHVKKKLKPGDRVIVLDERGHLWKTEELHEAVQQAMNASIKRLVFVIGGPFGHSPELRNEAHATLALSKMVMNHELARVCLVEQLYRVYTLIWGGDYHH